MILLTPPVKIVTGDNGYGQCDEHTRDSAVCQEIPWIILWLGSRPFCTYLRAIWL